MEIFRLFGSILINNDEANASLHETDQRAQSVGNTFLNGMDTIVKWGSAMVLAGAGALASLVALADGTAETADEIDKMSLRTGISFERLQELKYISGQVGVEFTAVQGAVAKMTQSMDKVDEGNKGLSEAFNKMGISVTDANGKLKKTDEIFDQTVRYLANMTNETERNALAFKVFGKGATELVPIFATGNKGLEELTKSAHDLGAVISDKAIKDLVAYGDTIADIKTAAKGAKDEFSIALLPALQEFAEHIKENAPAIIDKVKEMGAKFGEFVSVVGENMNTIINIAKVLAGVWLLHKTILAALWANKMMNLAADVLIKLETMAGTAATVLNTTATVIATGAQTAFGVSLSVTSTKFILVAGAIAIVIGLILLLKNGFNDAKNSIDGVVNSAGKVGNIKVPNATNMNSFDVGTNYVSDDQIAMIHKGEAIIPAKSNPFTGSNDLNNKNGDTFIFNVDMSEIDDVVKLKNMLNTLKQNKRQFA